MARSANNWVLPIGAAIVLVGGGLWAVSKNRAPKAEAPTEPEAPRPFADMPPEAPPPPRDGTGAPTPTAFGSAPSGLEEDERWQKALTIAADAEKRFIVARDALANGDRATANAEGSRSRVLFDEALESTALWEDELLASYSETDPQVRQIMKERSRWFERTLWLHKSISR